jgi:hypothetical protein
MTRRKGEIFLSIFTLIEIILVIKGKYLRILPPKFKWLSGILFYVLINFITNMIYLGLWRDGIV